MESKVIVVLQLLFDLIAGFLILSVILRRSSKASLWDKGTNMEEIRKNILLWERTAEELISALEARVGKIASISEELDRAEMRATETLERLHRAKEALLCAEGAYASAFELLREGLPPGEVAKRSGLGLAEVSFMKEVVSKEAAWKKEASLS